MHIIEWAQQKNYQRRRISRLVDILCRLIPSDSTVLDVGCGDGAIDRAIMERRPDCAITGCDVVRWPDATGQLVLYNGKTLPFDDLSYDYVMFIDVLHHAHNMHDLLCEGLRVAREGVVLKDHIANSVLDHKVLAFMDQVGNQRYGVALPYQYLSGSEWESCFSRFGLQLLDREHDLHLYPWWCNWIFGRNLHFAALLKKDSPLA